MKLRVKQWVASVDLCGISCQSVSPVRFYKLPVTDAGTVVKPFVWLGVSEMPTEPREQQSRSLHVTVAATR